VLNQTTTLFIANLFPASMLCLQRAAVFAFACGVQRAAAFAFMPSLWRVACSV
jgi:hypothetical protein